MFYKILFILLLSISFQNLYSQIESIVDSKYHRFNIGDKIKVFKNYETKFNLIFSKTNEVYTLLDTITDEDIEVVFIPEKYYEDEYQNYKDKIIKIYPNNLPSGVYYEEVIYRKKFLLIN